MAETEGIVYFVPQYDKVGSLMFRHMFNKRGEWHNNPSMGDWNIASDILRNRSQGDNKPMKHTKIEACLED